MQQTDFFKIWVDKGLLGVEGGSDCTVSMGLTTNSSRVLQSEQRAESLFDREILYEECSFKVRREH